MKTDHMVEALNNYWTKIFEFKGKANRIEFWIPFLAYCLFECLLVTFFGFSFVDLVLFIPMISLSVRRLHDCKLSGWWLLVILIPTFGWFIWLYLMTLPKK